MRVLYVNHTSRISGGEISLLTLLAGLPGDVEPLVACPPGPLADRLRERGVEVLPIHGSDGSLRLHPAHTPRAVAALGRTALQVRRLARRTGADLLHANSIRSGLIVAAAGVPTVVHVRDCLPPGRGAALALRGIARADAVIANSRYTRESLGPARGKARVVHNAVDLAPFAAAPRLTEARAHLGLAGEHPVLALVAQVTPWKAQDDALRIVARLLPEHPQLRLLLVGSAKFDSAATRYDNPAFERSLHRLAEDLGIADSVTFLGEREDIATVLAATDLLLAPSWEEPFGRTIVEAMAAGVPVVATAVGGPPEILGTDAGQAGLVLPPRSPAHWATEIAALLADPAEMEAMGRRGAASARERFGVERHVSAVRAVYEEALAAASRSG